jgi:hypothetical protein
MISLSGNTCTAGSTATISGSTYANAANFALLSSTLAHFTDGTKVFDLVLNTGSNSVTPYQNVTVSAGGTAIGISKNTSTSSIVLYTASSLLVGVVCTYTSTSTSPTLGTVSGTLATGTSTGTYYSQSQVNSGIALALITAGPASTVGPRFVLVKVVGGIPVLSSTGTFPGGTTSYRLYVNFVSGLGMTQYTTNYVVTNGGTVYAYQKIAVVGGI